MPATRREFLLATSAGIAAATLTPDAFSAPPSPKTALTQPLPSAFAAIHELKPLPFDPAKLDGLSEKLIRSHWENNYGASVKALNIVKQRLAAALADPDLPAFLYNDMKREHLLRTGSIVLHDLYFGNLGQSGKPDDSLRQALNEAFGSFAAWEKEFKRMGAGLGGGSGWVVLGYNLHTGSLENYWSWDHLHSPAATLPLLVMDMYEHSYQMDYGAAAPAYVDAFFRNIQWQVVATRWDNARKARALLG
ncbi:MAG: superoxide dismutase [Methylomonas sp.]|nr:superoxide dismutase [Methylomonas sp.]PPD20700.1 MAG: superoxide dismutase [Methylomonas sp.]PPD24209.1 MAG: superoxide dismutase [Methylomonas sp.]PPD32775.1 MAG: superoxide dismutase [Methylomonas sp.]PPD38952.1 MAG: superoxide dismutase [Methylomonas sp.]